MATGLLSKVGRLFARSFPLSPGPGNPWPLFGHGFKSLLFNKKKTPLLLGFLLIPLVVTLLISSSLDTYEADTTDGTVTAARGGRAWFQDLMSDVFFPLILPIVTAVYATAAIGDEVEGKTLPYLFTRPIYRSWMLLAKSLSTFLASILLAIFALSVTYFVAVGHSENPMNQIDQLFGYWSAIALGVLGAGGVFLLMGVLMRPAVIVIVMYTFVWETLLGNMPLPSSILQYSFVWYENAYINSFIDRPAGFVVERLVDVPTASEAVTTLVVLGVLGILGSLIVVSNRDYNV